MRPTCVLAAVALAATFGVACGTDAIDYGDPTDDPELPPRGTDDLDGWIAAGYYLTWQCEPGPMPIRDPSPHRPTTRTCSNALVRSTTSGPLPVGSATVKEMLDDANEIKGYGVSLKLPGDGPLAWYWYEKINGGVKAEGVNNGSCPGCHMLAPRDFTFVIVP